MWSKENDAVLDTLRSRMENFLVTDIHGVEFTRYRSCFVDRALLGMHNELSIITTGNEPLGLFVFNSGKAGIIVGDDELDASMTSSGIEVAMWFNKLIEMIEDRLHFSIDELTDGRMGYLV